MGFRTGGVFDDDATGCGEGFETAEAGGLGLGLGFEDAEVAGEVGGGVAEAEAAAAK